MLSKAAWPLEILAPLALVALVMGCGSSPTAAPSPAGQTLAAASDTETLASMAEAMSAASTLADVTEEHPHKPGLHGGIIVPIGRDSYHAEAVFEAGGKLRLYMLGRDEGRVQDVESQELNAFVKLQGAAESLAFSLHGEPQPGDAQEKTSLFVGQLPDGLSGQPLSVTIPSIRIAGERFRLGFQSAEPEHEELAGMPSGVSDADERKLYLTPGGKYTEADILANGKVTATEKFRGVKAQHDLHPKTGDVLCPITLTKGNPKFTWVVDGKAYEFCCPPCIDEFVRMAKAGDEIKAPEEFIKR